MTGPQPASTNAIAAAVEDYLNHLQQKRLLSPHTVDGYRRDLEHLKIFCEKNAAESRCRYPPAQR